MIADMPWGKNVSDTKNINAQSEHGYAFPSASTSTPPTTSNDSDVDI